MILHDLVSQQESDAVPDVQNKLLDLYDEAHVAASQAQANNTEVGTGGGSQPASEAKPSPTQEAAKVMIVLLLVLKFVCKFCLVGLMRADSCSCSTNCNLRYTAGWSTTPFGNRSPFMCAYSMVEKLLRLLV